MKRTNSLWHRTRLAILVFAVVAAAGTLGPTPARADGREHHDGWHHDGWHHGGWHGDGWRGDGWHGHPGHWWWNGRGYVWLYSPYPPAIYAPAPVYAPPPVVYAPPAFAFPSFTFVFGGHR